MAKVSLRLGNFSYIFAFMSLGKIVYGFVFVLMFSVITINRIFIKIELVIVEYIYN